MIYSSIDILKCFTKAFVKITHVFGDVSVRSYVKPEWNVVKIGGELCDFPHFHRVIVR